MLHHPRLWVAPELGKITLRSLFVSASAFSSLEDANPPEVLGHVTLTIRKQENPGLSFRLEHQVVSPLLVRPLRIPAALYRS